MTTQAFSIDLGHGRQAMSRQKELMCHIVCDKTF